MTTQLYNKEYNEIDALFTIRDIKMFEEKGLEQSQQPFHHKTLLYEKLVFDFLLEKYFNTKITKYNLLANLSKVGTNLTDERSYNIFPSRLVCKNNRYYLDKEDSKPRGSKGNELQEYIKTINLNKLGIKIFKNDNPKEIRFMDILILSLFYIYDCGRVYKIHTNKDGTEYYKTAKTYKNKKDCYVLVLNKVMELFDKEFFEKSSFEDRLYASAQLHRIDYLFKFYKVCMMSRQMDDFLRNEVERHSISQKYYAYLGCNNAEDIISSYTNCVFRNAEFVKFCLATEYSDPFGCFIGFVNLTITNCKNLNINNISDFLDICKKQTLENIKEKLKLVSKNLFEDEFRTIYDMESLNFQPEDECGKEFKNSANKLIHTFHKYKYEELNSFFEKINSMRLQTDKNTLRKTYYEFFEDLAFVPDKTNFLNMLRNTNYTEEETESYFYTHEEAKMNIEASIKIMKENHGFWEKYYFDSIEILKSYAESWPESEDDYTKYLFELVIEDLNDICVYKNQK